MPLTFDQVKNNPKIKSFIKQTEKYMDALGFTDHGFRHVNIIADRARSLSRKIGLPTRAQELAAICGYCHDMGNFMGRTQHHYWAAILFAQIFMDQSADANEIAEIMQAIVSHDKNELKIVDSITAVLILADKSDVDRSRVRLKKRNPQNLEKDINDRVNYSVTENDLDVDKKKKEIILALKLDTKITNDTEFFEIFIDRMTFCRLAAEYLGYKFVLVINNQRLS